MTRSLLIVLAACTALAGCDKLPNPMNQAASTSKAVSAVAVLDLAAVAKALGRDEVFKQQVQAAGRQLQQQLTDISSGLRGKLQEEQDKIGEAPTQEQQQQLQRLAVTAQRQLQQSQVLARQKAAQFQSQLAAQFRSEIQPVAAEVARSKGATAVLLSNNTLWFESAVDITGQVIDEMRARGAEAAAPALKPEDPPAETTSGETGSSTQ